ncbi:MAG: GNAT family N-acetyltransferase [Clostridia bacterium]|nr:GNAT family N-acetyltransferase [Clostridia bacterium]
MPVELLRVKNDSLLLEDVMALYLRAFPANERRPLDVLLRDESGASDVLAVREGDGFVGLAILLTWRDITHILYFAVSEELRGRGLGGEILRSIRTLYPRNRIIADIEQPYDGAPDDPLRRRRMAFYARNGFAPTEIQYTWRGERYIIVAMGGSVSEQEFDDFWDYFYNQRGGFDY